MPTVAEVAAKIEGISNRDFRYRSRLFVQQFGTIPVEEITVLDVLGYREQIIKSYKPWTAHEYISAAKRIVLWAASLGLRPPIDLSAVKGAKPKPQSRKVWDPSEVRRLLSLAAIADPRVEAFMRLQYLACLRPSETLRLAKGEAERLSDELLVLEEHKTSHHGQPRFIVMSDGANKALEDAKQAKPKRSGRSKDSRCPWSRLDAYSKACYMACGKRPHLLRHSAATSLLNHGVKRADVDLLLGHSVGNRISLTYMKVLEREFTELLPSICLLCDDLDGERQ